MSDVGKTVRTIAVAVLLLCVGFLFVPEVRSHILSTQNDVRIADDASRYETRKQVEDTARAMIASYTADNMTYAQYKDSMSEERRGWAEQAKMRANRTAAVYNEYVLKNSYVWSGNVPEDIALALEYVTSDANAD